jgi:hypothetical protein
MQVRQLQPEHGPKLHRAFTPRELCNQLHDPDAMHRDEAQLLMELIDEYEAEQSTATSK